MSLSRFSVECVDRATGQSTIRSIEAMSAEDAAQVAAQFGYITGRVTPDIRRGEPGPLPSGPRRWLTSRWGAAFEIGISAIFRPTCLTVSEGKLTIDRAASVLFPWVRETEEMTFAKIASVHHRRGLIWDAIAIETTGGTARLAVGALRKSDAEAAARMIRAVLPTGPRSAN